MKLTEMTAPKDVFVEYLGKLIWFVKMFNIHIFIPQWWDQYPGPGLSSEASTETSDEKD